MDKYEELVKMINSDESLLKDFEGEVKFHMRNGYASISSEFSLTHIMIMPVCESLMISVNTSVCKHSLSASAHFQHNFNTKLLLKFIKDSVKFLNAQSEIVREYNNVLHNYHCDV